jgi:hypothetical protein
MKKGYILAGFIVMLFFALGRPVSAQQAVFYVSPDGDDENSGTISEPFQTIAKARDAVDAINGDMSGDIIVYLRGGTYYLSDTIEFDEGDGGTNDHRVIYKAYSDETPVVSGGVLVSDWTKHSGNIWKADLNRAGKLRHLYVNGRRAYMSSISVSAQGGWGSYTITEGQDDWAWTDGTEYDGVKYNLDDVAEVDNPAYVEIQNYTTWNSNYVSVRDIVTDDDGYRVALLEQPYGAIALNQGWGSGFSTSGTHILHNAYEWLDGGGEFYFDDPANVVYYYPHASEDMTIAEVYAPNEVETLIRVQGTSTSNRVQNLTFQGITFAHADYQIGNDTDARFAGKATVQADTVAIAYANSNWHKETYRNIDTLDGAIMVENAEDIRFEKNVIKHGGSYGIGFINDVINSQIVGNYIFDMGGSGVVVGHPQHVYIGDGGTHEKYAAGVEGLCINNDVHNNLIYDVTNLFWGHSGITAFFVKDLDMQHNQIEKVNYSGVSLGWGWKDFDEVAYPSNPTSTAKKNVFNYNYIHDTINTLTDTGAFYTLGSMPGSVFNGNYFKDVDGGDKNFGFHMDEGTAYVTGENNVLDISADGAYSFGMNKHGRKHNITFDNTYTTSPDMDRVLYKGESNLAPDSSVTNVHMHSDGDWPSAGLAIIEEAGLESEYEYLLELKPAYKDVTVNFQSSDAIIPSGYVPDSGGVYGTKNGYTYGWNTDHTDQARERGNNTDQKLDTLIHFESDGVWEMELANGNYNVLVSVGDPSNASTNTINVEGVNYWNSLSLSSNSFKSLSQTVTVTDGKLTIDQGGAASKATRINFVEITAGVMDGSSPNAAYAGLKLWVNADADNVTKDDSNYVSALTDLSGNETITSETGYDSPLWVSSAIGGQPAIRFDGSGDRLAVSSLSSIGEGDDRTIFVVMQYTSLENNNEFFGTGTKTMMDVGTWRGSSQRLRLRDTSNDANAFSKSNTVETGTRNVLTVVADSNLTKAWNNESLIISTSSEHQHYSLASGVGIGHTGYSGREYSGDIAEILIYDEVLSDADRAAIEAYLINKY